MTPGSRPYFTFEPPGYQLHLWRDGTLVTHTATFGDWQHLWFTPAHLGDSSIAGVTATPANDGVPNLVKYAFNLNPLRTTGSQGNPSLPVPTVSGSNLTLTFNATQTDVNYSAEASTDLFDWSDDGVTLQANGTLKTASHAIPTSGAIYLRIVITPIP